MGGVKRLSVATAGAVFVSLGAGFSHLGEPAKAVSFSNIYAFGDSLTDTGNVDNTADSPPINFPIPFPPPPYYEGHFSNGPVWIESLASKLELTVSPSTKGGNNFAYGGAESGTENVLNKDYPLIFEKNPLLGLQQEVQGFIEELPSQGADPNALYTVWAGANDYLGGGQTTDTETVGNLLDAVISLNDAGAKNILVVNLPDLGKIPSTRNDPESAFLTALSQQHNSDLALELATLSQGRGSSINIIPLDVYSTFEAIIADPEKYGFTNVTESCLNLTTNTLCSEEKSVQDQYFSWDGLHPTEAGHDLIAEAAFKAVPEPASTLGILTFGALGAGSLLKRSQKQQQRKATSHTKSLV